MATVKTENQRLKLQAAEATQRASALQEQLAESSKGGDSAIKSQHSDVLAQLVETFGATDPEQVLSKVMELHETSRLIEDEL